MSDDTDEGLSRELGLLSALTIGVGVMVCAGIFVLPASVAESAGPAAMLAFVLAGFIASFTALSISELSTAMPKAGGAYYYVNDALGPLFGCIAGWGNWVGLTAAVAFYLIGFGSYADMLVSVPGLEVGILELDPAQVVALGAGACFLGLNFVGTQETGRVQIAIVVVLIVALGGFAANGLLEIDSANLHPFAPEETGGWLAIFPAAALVFVSYLGFAEIATAAEEIEDPDRNLPLAVIGSLVFATVLYAVVMLVLVGVVPYRQLIGHGELAVLEVGRELVGTPGMVALTTAGLLAMASSANASILASSRINFAMARDRLMPSAFSKVHSTFETPYRSIAVTAGLVTAFILAGDIEILAKAGSVLHLIVYGMLNVALIIYREADEESYQPSFEAPGYPYTPILGAVFSFGLIGFMETIEILMSLGFVLFGLIWYVVYARHHARHRGVLARLLESDQ